MVWLQERRLDNTEKLAATYEAAVEKYNNLSEKTKANQARMNEIAELQKQIGAYGKTKDIYVQYRKLPKNKQEKFYEEHRSDITVHEAAKKYFDSLHLQKLPTIKELKQEYAVLSAENKKLYPEQKAARKEMIDLLTAKNNVERFLEIKIEQPDREEKKKEESR
ncbi:MAG: hypothetical protein LUE65_12635 [Clostridiales bacterium]|nr:hypothetical protein [Clostridiales bacterium]